MNESDIKYLISSYQNLLMTCLLSPIATNAKIRQLTDLVEVTDESKGTGSER